MPITYDVASADEAVKALSLVRLLLSDVDDATHVFTDAEIQGFLALEGDSVKLAAAQAIDANATNEVLASKVLDDHQLSTDGAKVADAMRKHAAALRAQVVAEDDGFFEVIDFGCGGWPELTNRPYF